MRRFLSLVLLTLCLLVPRLAHAQEPLAPVRLSLSDALNRARHSSPTIIGAQARIAGAQARLQGANALAGPILVLAQPFGSPATGGFDEGVVLSQTIEIGKRGPRTRVARAEVQSARFDAAGVGTSLDFAVRAAYFGALLADVELRLAQDARQTARTFDLAARTQFEAGDVPRQNTVRSAIELSRAGQAQRAAQVERDNRYAALKSLIGLPEATWLELSDALAFEARILDAAALQTLAMERRADVQGARAAVVARQAAIGQARSQRLPDAFVEARRAAIVPRDGQDNGNSLRVGVSLPLFGGQTRALVREAQAGEQEAAAALAEAERVGRLEVTTSLATFESAQQAVQDFDAGRLARSRELLDMAQIGYQQGASSYLELLDAQAVFRSEQADYARALATFNTALADLQRAVGGELTAPVASPVATAPVVEGGGR